MSELDSEKPIKKPKKVKPVGADGHRQRMYKRLQNAGNGYFAPRDMLEILLFYPIKVRDTRDSAVLLMQKFKNNIKDVLNAAPIDLCEVDGIGPSCALFLNIVGESVRRSTLPSKTPIDRDIDKLPALLREKCEVKRNDELWALYFNHFGKFLSSKKLSFNCNDFVIADLMELLYDTSPSAAYVCIARFLKEGELLMTNEDISDWCKYRNFLSCCNMNLWNYCVVLPQGIISTDQY